MVTAMLLEAPQLIRTLAPGIIIDNDHDDEDEDKE